MREFEKALRDEAFGYTADIIKDSSVDTAIKQIKEKEYMQKFGKEYGEVLAVAICYDSGEKEHECRIERVGIG